MASPQIENGYIKIANELFEALIKTRIPGEARQVLDIIIRQTYGFNKIYSLITLDKFALATGLRKCDVLRALKKLYSMNLVSKKANGNYHFVKDFDTWKPLAKKQTISKKANNDLLKSKFRLAKKQISTDEPKDTYKDIVIKTLQPIQVIVEEFKKLKGYDKIKDWDKQHFARHLKPAKKMLEILPISECLEVLQLEGTKLNQGTKREDWVLEWVIAKIPDYQLKKQAEVKKQQEQQEAQDRYAKLEESRKRAI